MPYATLDDVSYDCGGEERRAKRINGMKKREENHHRQAFDFSLHVYQRPGSI